MSRPPTKFYRVNRTEALSDGIFAIALTLLVLELKLPESAVAQKTLLQILAEDWHPFLGWIISFIVLARLWMIQHDLLASASRCSSRTIMINFVFLATISLVPFSAHIVGLYELSEPLALQIFAVQLTISALALAWLIRSSVRDDPSLVASHWARQIRHHLFFVPVIAILAAVIANFVPVLSLAIFGLESIAVLVLLVVRTPAEPETP
jgi:uncharacterized membrane protein